MNLEEAKKTILAQVIQKQTRYEAGDVVATPMGTGVVAASMESDFEFPIAGDEEEDDATRKVQASESSPAYVVAFGGRSGVFRAEDLEQTTFEGDESFTEGEALASIAEVDVTEDDLPDGWDVQSLLDYWADIGTWTACVEGLQGEVDSPESICSDRKTLVLGTERWRNRF